MPKYVIEREVPGVGQMSPAELEGIARKSNEVLDSLAGRAQWLQSYVTDSKIYCVYIADNADTVREHAECGGFPANMISHVATIIDPTTGWA